MKITYDPKIDAMYIKFQDGVFVSNKEAEEGIIFDIGKNNAILGIEILEASQRLKSKNISRFDIQIPLPVMATA
ncbi:DUF2283 domain-containing protein [Candidatus Wolfebacteria bacterium]|nr:DUF2283 domain-containing protein [Candidatus Wolfebacteria bacterium]